MSIQDFKLAEQGGLSIAADARLGLTSYTDDHIWSLNLTEGEPPALSIQTSYGLRAKKLCLFPRFLLGDSSYMNPSDFYSSAKICKFLPNYLKVCFSPLEGIDVEAEYWVPNSNVLTGRLFISNSRLKERKITFQWTALLIPDENGQRMVPHEKDTKLFLYGQTSGLFPALYLTGSPTIGSGPYPSLSIDMDLLPGDTRQFKWAHATTGDLEKSIELSSNIINKHWDAEIARIEVENGGLLHILTGDPEWNDAFRLAQNYALKSLIKSTQHIPNIFFVLAREPDQGYSAIGDGSDYNYLWTGQTILDTDYLSTILLPAYPSLVKGLVENILHNQSEDGFISFNLGLAGQRGKMLATPILVNLVWRLYQVSEDRSFLEQVFPRLVKYIQAWFTPDQDRDGDGIPEWDHPSQSGYENNPLFSSSNPLHFNAEITKTESPSLCAFLFNEINILLQIAQLINQLEILPTLAEYTEKLRIATEASWDERVSSYRYWDRESHCCTRGERLGQMNGSGEIFINRTFTPPVRLVFKVILQYELRRDIEIFIHGVGMSGNKKIERIENDRFSWQFHQAYVVSESLFSSIEFIDIIGAEPEDLISVGIMDLSEIDHTSLLPLWVQIPAEERASDLVKNTISNPLLFWKSYGISAGQQINGTENKSKDMVHMIWNSLIGEGMLRYGFRKEAADLVTRLMNGVILNLKKYQSFYSFYDGNTGTGYGDRNTLRGLPPIHLFLETLGVRIISPRKIFLQGSNPFPWTVTLHYKGLTVIRESDKTKILFPGGQTAIINSEDPRIVQMEFS